MQHSALTKGLNKEQSLAVTHSSGSLAVIAGAGSGKTKVLTQRIAFLLETHAWRPENILAVTFTNKAAEEMKKRLSALGIKNVTEMWVGTFHGLANRFLRYHHEQAGLARSFQIIDAQEQEKIIKKLFKSQEWDEKLMDPKELMFFINDQKDKGLRPSNAKNSSSDNSLLQEGYAFYQDLCDKNNWVDFGELLIRTFELFQNENILHRYQSLFRHVLVDEFQDTNDIQYAWIELLCGRGQSVPATIVGDMDQSIYSWRGAKMQNVERFVNEFAETSLIKLEQNYRSTHSILSCANSVIKNNKSRIDKTLWTQKVSGDPVTLFEGRDDKEEAEWAIIWLTRHRENNVAWKDLSVLYRSNAQSRILEEACIKRGIPYKIHGGLRFFERAEIKDALAHMHAVYNIDNDLMLERALTSPAKGFGPKALDALRKESLKTGASWASLLDDPAFAKENLTAKARTEWGLYKDLIAQKSALALDELARFVIEKTGLMEVYRVYDKKEGTDKVENLKEFVSVAKRYQEGHSSKDLLEDFLTSVALESDNTREEGDTLNLMTIHASKGLEFPFVCLVGWDEGIFPSSQSAEDPSRMEEERRLAYVAITRAEKKLAITGTAARRQYGQFLELPPSRFFAELPKEYILWARPPLRGHKLAPDSSLAARLSTQNRPSYWNIGDGVCHPQFGQGKIVRVDGAGKNDRVVVQFGMEKKTLLPQLAKLEKV